VLQCVAVCISCWLSLSKATCRWHDSFMPHATWLICVCVCVCHNSFICVIWNTHTHTHTRTHTHTGAQRDWKMPNRAVLLWRFDLCGTCPPARVVVSVAPAAETCTHSRAEQGFYKWHDSFIRVLTICSRVVVSVACAAETRANSVAKQGFYTKWLVCTWRGYMCAREGFSGLLCRNSRKFLNGIKKSFF